MKKIIIVSILFLSAISNIFAEKNAKTQEPLTLTVEDAVSYAITNSKSLKSSEIDLEIKKRAKMYSWNVFLPSLNVSGTISRTNEVSNMIMGGDTSAFSLIEDQIVARNIILDKVRRLLKASKSNQKYDKKAKTLKVLIPLYNVFLLTDLFLQSALH
jgi:hypothetical protein